MATRVLTAPSFRDPNPPTAKVNGKALVPLGQLSDSDALRVYDVLPLVKRAAIHMGASSVNVAVLVQDADGRYDRQMTARFTPNRNSPSTLELLDPRDTRRILR